MTTRTVTGTIKHLDGTAWNAASVSFELLVNMIVDGDLYPSETKSTTTNSSGEFSITLTTPDEGTAVYRVTTPSVNQVFFLAAGPATDLETILTIPVISDPPSDLQTLIDTHIAASDPHTQYLKETALATSETDPLFAASEAADFETGDKSRLDHVSGSMHNVLDYGAVGDGVTNDTTAIQAAITAAAVSGGIVFIPAQHFIVSGQLFIPNGGETIPKQKTVRLTGIGGSSGGQGYIPSGGSMLDLRYSGPGEKIKTRGIGLLEIDHLVLMDGGTSSNAFIFTTQTTLHIHHCQFEGNPSKSSSTCDQDVIILGGTTAVSDGSDDSGFQGYETVIESNYFNRVRRIVYGRVWANAVTIANNTVWGMSGSNLDGGACIEFDAMIFGVACIGNYIYGNTLECGAYPYPIKLTKANNNVIVANGFYDVSVTNLSFIRFEDYAGYNFVISGYYDTYPLFSELTHAYTTNRNLVFDSSQEKTTVFPYEVRFNTQPVIHGLSMKIINDANNFVWDQLALSDNLFFRVDPGTGTPVNLFAVVRVDDGYYHLEFYGTHRTRLAAPAGGDFEIYSKAGDALWLGDPSNQLYVLNGDAYFSASKGPIIKSPNGSKFRIKVADDGSLSTEAA